MADAGADAIFDFVDAGLPSTVCSAEEYRRALMPLLSRMAAVAADAAVIEIGASPLEPYNGAVTIKEIGRNVRVSILCASDPYAVHGRHVGVRGPTRSGDGHRGEYRRRQGAGREAQQRPGPQPQGAVVAT